MGTLVPSEATLNRTIRVVLWPLGAAATGIIVAAAGIGATFLVAQAVGSGDGWTDVAVAVLGSFGSVALGVLVWLALLVVGARRLFPRGSRLVPVLVSAVIVLAVVVLGGPLVRSADPGTASTVVLVLAVLATLGAPAVVFLLRERRERARAVRDTALLDREPAA